MFCIREEEIGQFKKFFYVKIIKRAWKHVRGSIRATLLEGSENPGVSLCLSCSNCLVRVSTLTHFLQIARVYSVYVRV